MAKTKRALEQEVGTTMNDVHPSRTKRLKYSDEDAELAKIYNDLADEVQDVRIKAAGDLIKNLSTEIPGRMERLDAAETRLVKGLCSGRKAARLGFSIALAELIRLRARSKELASSPVSLDEIAQLTTPQGNVSGQERRDYLLGRRFAFQAVLQSDVALDKDFPSHVWNKLIGLVFELALEKPWLRRDCGSMLYEYLKSRTSQLKTARVQAIIDLALEHKLLKTPEGVGLWIIIQNDCPKVDLPQVVWHHDSPLSSKERDALSKLLLEDATSDDPSVKAGNMQSSPSFVWSVILSNLFNRDDSKTFRKFWDTCVASAMFSSKASAERRSLGLRIFSLALSLAPVSELKSVLQPNIIRCILDQRTGSDGYLFDAAKIPLNRMISLTNEKSGPAPAILKQLLFKGAINFDQITKTKTVESIINSATEGDLIEVMRGVFEAMKMAPGIQKSELETYQRQLADLTLTIIRAHKSSRASLPNALSAHNDMPDTWLVYSLQMLSNFAYHDAMSSPIRRIVQTRLTSCLNSLMDAPLQDAAKAPVLTAWFIMQNIEALKVSEYTKSHLREAKSCVNQLYNPGTEDTTAHAFAMMISMGVLQVLNDELDAIALLQDLIACYKAKDDSADSTTMLVELLLSFVSKPSSLFRKLAEQVFSVLAQDITVDSLQSLTDILGQKESLSGQQELFEEHAEDEETEDQVITDVEDASDVELVNGDATSEGEDSDSGSNESSVDEEGATHVEDDEEAVFDKKLAEALGTAAVGGDSEDDGSDMDDDQMLAMEHHLTSIFKERKQATSKKQEKKDAKENIVNFKNRVLDLLTVYVKTQSGSVLALDLILPLTNLIRTTTSKQTAEKAFAVLRQYFETSNKNKILPQPDDDEDSFSILAELHKELKRGESKLHAHACSRSGLFMAKVLVALDHQHYRRVASMYHELHTEWMEDSKLNIQSLVFTEWMSWSISLKRQSKLPL